MPSRITRVALKDYRSIGSCDVEIGPLTLLVGPNGSGKSNFLDALRFLAESMYAPLDHVLQARSGIRSILRKLPKGELAESFSIEVGFELEDMRRGLYLLHIGELARGRFVILEEHCEIGDDRFTSIHGDVEGTIATKPTVSHDRPALVAFGGTPEFAPVFRLLAGMMFYSPKPELMRVPAPVGTGHLLNRDASNAADVLAGIERDKPGTIERIRGYLNTFNPEFRDVTVTEAGDYRWLAFVPAANPSNWRLPGSEVSDGTLRAVAILLAIFQPSSTPGPLSLIGLEEPESNLHPAAAGVLLDALMEGSAHVPIVATTHSADLLDRKDLPESALLAVALHEGQTVIGPLSADGKSILRKRLYTAGELMRSNQLAPANLPAQR